MVIAVDVGGTHMRIALVDLSGDARIVRMESRKAPQDYEEGIEALSIGIAEMAGSEKIQGIGACFPGIIDVNDMVTTANNLPDWTMKPIRHTLEARFDVPVKLVHDAQAPAIGEALFGAARGSDRFVYFIWGTGIGAADIKRIDLDRFFMFSFENGHHILDWDGIACTCGQRGCPEAYLGGDNLRAFFGKDMETVTDDDPFWEPVIKIAAQVVINTLIFHPVDLFVFSGGVITKRPFLLNRIRSIMQERLTMFPVPKMVLAEKGDQSALFGCAGLFKISLI